MAMQWKELAKYSAVFWKTQGSAAFLVNGPCNPWSRVRLFEDGKEKNSTTKKKKKIPRVTLYRDHHAWCPYCEKVWLFLEEKKIPYRVSKISMFCFGEKEAWYKKKVARNGMLPAIALDGRVVTESDVILAELEKAFGPLYKSMHDPYVKKLRNLERELFRSWCGWLCYPSASALEAERSKARFVQVVSIVDRVLSESSSAFFLDDFSIVDTIFVPYVERMSASLYYYKGFLLRDKKRFPNLCSWFDALEDRESTYRGLQSDFHTHVKDLPPQMGGCYASGDAEQIRCARHCDDGPWETLLDATYDEPDDSKIIAVARVVKHRKNILRANPVNRPQLVDAGIRVALTKMCRGVVPGDGEERKLLLAAPKDTAKALLYIRDRINVPRDMPIWSARRLRQSLDDVVKEFADEWRENHVSISHRHRRDQDPRGFEHGGEADEFDPKRALRPLA